MFLEKSDDGVFEYVVGQHNVAHNHPIGRIYWIQYPENRMRLSEEEKKQVHMLYLVGLSTKKIHRFIMEKTKSNPNLRDVHNLIAKIKSHYKGHTTTAQRVRVFMDDFCDETSSNTKGNIGRVFTDPETKSVKCVTLQTAFMRRIFGLFPEVLLIDATHGTNNANYKLFSIMVHSTFGGGEIVQVRRPTVRASVDTDDIRFVTVDFGSTTVEHFCHSRVPFCHSRTFLT